MKTILFFLCILFVYACTAPLAVPVMSWEREMIHLFFLYLRKERWFLHKKVSELSDTYKVIIKELLFSDLIELGSFYVCFVLNILPLKRAWRGES